MTIKMPRYQFDDSRNLIREEQDPAEARRYAIAYWRNILTATDRNGSTAFSQSVRTQAEQRLQTLLAEVGQ